MNQVSKTELSKAKPFGVVLIVIYTAINGVLSFIDSIIAFFTGTILAGQDFELLVTLLGIVFLICGVLSLAACYGMWALQTWGPSVAKILYLIYLSLGIIEIVAWEMTASNVISQLFVIAFAIWILFYLEKPETKSLYQME